MRYTSPWSNLDSHANSKNRGIHRRDILKAAIGVSLTAGISKTKASSSIVAKSANNRPNILWITMEDTCPQFLGCYGNVAAHTPNMDRLASEGVRFTRAFSTAPVCAPSRCSIITGCLPEVLGTGNHRSYYPIPDFIKGFPYYLRRAGYFTSNNQKTDYNLGNEHHFIKQAWDECKGDHGWGTTWNYNTDTFDENSQEAGWWHRHSDQPFFSVFNLMNSHQSRTMTNPHEWYVEQILNKLPAGKRISPDHIVMPPFYRDTPDMRQHVSRVYNSLSLTDWELGRILRRLEQDKLSEDTIVFCFADHGEGIPRCKTSEIGLGYQVPFFIYFPPKYKHLSPWPIGKPASELISSAEDVAPTVLSLAGVEIPHYMHGRPLLGSQRRPPRPYVWAGRNRIDESPDLARAVCDGRFFYTRIFMPQLPLVKYMKYMETGDIMRTIRADQSAGLLNSLQSSLISQRQPNEYLYDLDNDPWQINNLAEAPACHENLQALRNALQKHIRETCDVHFMPEYELARQSARRTPYEFRKDIETYPLERIVKAANLVGAGSHAISNQVRYLTHSNGIVRYWAAIGLDSQGEVVRPFEQDIIAALADPQPYVQIVIAGIAYKIFRSAKARKILEYWLKKNNRLATLQAVQTIEYMREQGSPFVPDLHQLLAVVSKQPSDAGGAGNINLWATQVDLHFLQGFPIYYKSYAKWTPQSQMDINTSIHF